MKKFVISLNRNIQILLMLIAVAGLWFTYVQLNQNAKASKYMYLTGVWNDIMKESIERPEFNDKSKTLVCSTAFDPDTRLKYESYARWIGGFIEDLYINDYKKEKWFYYDPWIDSMLETHSTWFIDHMHYYVHTKDMHNRLLEMKGNFGDRCRNRT